MSAWRKITLVQEDITLCWKFSNDIIHSNNQYDRMMKGGLSVEDKLSYRIKRTFVGKVGELAFYRVLEKNGIHLKNFNEMFTVFEGQTNVDSFDFQTADGASVDIKTAVFFNHKNLVVPIDQFLNIPKDFYVGIKLELLRNIKSYDNSFIPDCIGDINICGFADYEEMQNCPTINLGEFDCKAKPLVSLKNIDELINLF